MWKREIPPLAPHCPPGGASLFSSHSDTCRHHAIARDHLAEMSILSAATHTRRRLVDDDHSSELVHVVGMRVKWYECSSERSSLSAPSTRRRRPVLPLRITTSAAGAALYAQRWVKCCFCSRARDCVLCVCVPRHSLRLVNAPLILVTSTQ